MMDIRLPIGILLGLFLSFSSVEGISNCTGSYHDL